MNVDIKKYLASALLAMLSMFVVTPDARTQAVEFGTDCSGLFPAATTTFSGSVTPGQSATLSLTGAPSDATVVLIVGVSNELSTSGTPLPTDLSSIDGVNAGCNLLISTEFFFVFTADSLGELNFGFKIPHGLGDDLFFQWAIFEQASPLSITLTKGIHVPLTNTVTPSDVDLGFESAYVGETTSADLTLTNDTDRPQTIEDVLVFDADASDFAITFPSAYPFTLQPSQGIVGTVDFTPSMGGLRTAKLEIVHFDLPLGFLNPVVDVSGIALESFGNELHVDAGGPGIFDSQFQIWSPDFGSTTGFLDSTRSSIGGTADEELYQSWRYGPAVTYEFAVPNDDYEVELHFVEPTAMASAERVFDVYLEGVLVLADIDLFTEVGAATATQFVASAPVTDGAITIELVGSTGDGIVAGIEVRRLFTGLMLSDVELDFGFVAGGDELVMPITLTNTGTDTIDISNISFDIGTGGGSGDQFKLTLDGVDYTGATSDVTLPSTLMLAPGADIQADITFQPTDHFSNEILLSFDGNFSTQTVTLIGAGGSEGHPYLHVVIEGEAVWVDYNQDGMASVTLDGFFSHTHEPGKVLVDHEWTDIADNVLSATDKLQMDFPLGLHTVCLKITDDNVPGESLEDCFTFEVVAPDMVPGVLALYYPEAGGDPAALLDAIPATADFAEIVSQMRVDADGGVGSSPYGANVMVQLIGAVTVDTAGDYEFFATGGVEHRLELAGVPVSGATALTPGTYALEARFAVEALGELPIEVTLAVDGGSAAPILGDVLYHDETNIAPVINTMPSEGVTLGGNAIDIQGFGFFPENDVTVHWGASDLSGGSINVPNTSSITFSSPPMGAGVIAVTVETPQGVSNTRFFEYDPAANPPINWSSKEIVTVSNPTQGLFGPDGKLYTVGRYGELYETTLDDDYNAVSTITHPGVSSLAPNHETLGIAINPYETSPLRIYVAHSDLYAQGGNVFEGPAPFVGQISYLEAPNFDTPVAVATNLPTSNHDHGLNGMFFDNNGDLYLSLGSNTNAGIKHPKSGDLPESPLTAAVLKFATSKPGFNGNVQHALTVDGTLIDDQVFGEQVDIVAGVDVEVWAPGVRNGFDMVYTTKRRIYATDNGPNVTFGNSSTGPDTEGPPVGKPDEFLLLEPGNYYGHPNRARGRTDPRQNIYRAPDTPAIAGEYTAPLSTLSSSTNGLIEYRADTFGGQMRGDLLAQRWNSTIRRLVMSDDGRSIQLSVNFENIGSLDLVHGPGGAILGIDYNGDAIRVLMPVDVSATGMTAYDVFPWRATPQGGQKFIIGGANFGTLGDTSVQIGTLAATVTSVSPTRIVGTLPAQANPTTDLLDIIVFSGGEVSIIADAFRYLRPTPGNEPGHWDVRDEMPVDLGEVAAGVVGPRLFVVGEGDARTLALNLITDAWDDTRAQRPFVGHHHGAEVIDGKLYLISGIGGGSEGRVQIYDHVLDTWTEGAAMPWTGGSLSTALIDGKIYAAGGIVGSNTVANAGVYDPVADSWTSIMSMPVGRNHAAAGTDGEKFYVFGGRSNGNWVTNGFDDVQVYDPDTDTWEWDKDGLSTLAPLPLGRGGMGKAIWWDNEFYVFGGETQNGPGANIDKVYNRVDVYSPATNTWRAEAAMPSARHGMFPLVCQSRMFLVGGGNKAGNDQEGIVEVFQRY